MTAEPTYTDYLVDILDAIVKTEQFLQGMTFDHQELWERYPEVSRGGR
jgi:hypothetical protein